MKPLLKRFLCITILALSVLVMPVSAYAEDSDANMQFRVERYDDTKYQSSGVRYYMVDGTVVHQGGYNTYRGCKRGVTRDEILNIETEVRLSNEYVLINTEDKDVSDADLATFYKGLPEFSNFDDEVAGDKNVTKIYLHKAFFYRAVEYYADHMPDETPPMFLDVFYHSMVKLDYRYATVEENKGMADLCDDALPDTDRCGWVQISSPVDTLVTLENVDTLMVYQFPIHKGETVLHKIRNAQYTVKVVNTVFIQRYKENSLPYNNQLQIGWNGGDSPDNPYVIDLGVLVEKYGIEDCPEEWLISGATDIRPFTAYFPEEPVKEVVTEDKKKVDPALYFFLFFGLVCIVVCVGIYFYKPKDEE